MILDEMFHKPEEEDEPLRINARLGYADNWNRNNLFLVSGHRCPLCGGVFPGMGLILTVFGEKRPEPTCQCPSCGQMFHLDFGVG